MLLSPTQRSCGRTPAQPTPPTHSRSEQFCDSMNWEEQGVPRGSGALQGSHWSNKPLRSTICQNNMPVVCVPCQKYNGFAPYPFHGLIHAALQTLLFPSRGHHSLFVQPWQGEGALCGQTAGPSTSSVCSEHCEGLGPPGCPWYPQLFPLPECVIEF